MFPLALSYLWISESACEYVFGIGCSFGACFAGFDLVEVSAGFACIALLLLSVALGLYSVSRVHPGQLDALFLRWPTSLVLTAGVVSAVLAFLFTCLGFVATGFGFISLVSGIFNIEAFALSPALTDVQISLFHWWNLMHRFSTSDIKQIFSFKRIGVSHKRKYKDRAFSGQP